MRQRKRILIVDNEPSVLFVLRGALRSLNDAWDIITAPNGSEGWKRIREQPCNLVITDLRMPGLDGVELTEAIRAFYPSTAIVWMTAYDCYQVLQVRKRLGVYRCVNKPLEIEEIRSIAREALKAQARLLHLYPTGGRARGTAEQENRHTG
jgi:DNA-binding NtrC family response regulator